MSARYLRNRTKDLQNIGETLTKGQMDTQVVQYLRTKKTKQEREQMIQEVLGKDLVLELPEKQSLAMKADLEISWFGLNRLRGYVMFSRQ